jgi:hypothetical protein
MTIERITGFTPPTAMFTISGLALTPKARKTAPSLGLGDFAAW